MIEIEKLADKIPDQQSTNYLENICSPSEIKTLRSYKMEKRRQEWFAGRICAKMAAVDFITQQHGNHLEMNQIVIDNMPSGRPFITCPDHHLPQSECDLSISHSGRYAIAMTAADRCGLDIQEPRQTLVRVKDRFCLDGEVALLHDAIAKPNDISCLTLLWAAKEAVRKTYSLQFIPEFLHLALDSVEASGSGWLRITFRHTHIKPTVICGLYQDYGIAICITGGSPSARTT